MRAQIKGLDQAGNNAKDGVSVISTAEGAINEIQSMLTRLKELSVLAANDVNSDDDFKLVISSLILFMLLSSLLIFSFYGA